MTDPEATERPGSSSSKQGANITTESRRRSSSRSPLPSPEEQRQQQPEPLQLPPFQPLFTLVTDTTTRATHHPQVRYIFSDDDPDLLTSALAHHHSSLAFPDRPSSPSALDASASSFPGAAAARNPRLPPPDRAVVLDLVTAEDGSGTGYDVAWASSLTSDWAVTAARVLPMAGDESGATGTSKDDEGEGAVDNVGRRLMLQIEGVSVEEGSSGSPARSTLGGAAGGVRLGGGKTPSPGTEAGDMQLSGAGSSRDNSGGGRHGQGAEEDYGTLIEEFEKRLGVLKKVVDAGEERQRKMAAADELDGQPQVEVEGDVQKEDEDDTARGEEEK